MDVVHILFRVECVDEVALQAEGTIKCGEAARYRQAIAATSGEWSTGSSTSSGEEDALACRLHFVQRTVLRQERQQRTELDAEGLLGGTQDNVPHVVARLLRFHQQRAEIRERGL